MTIEEAKKGFDELKAQGMTEDEMVSVLYLMFQDDAIDLKQFGELVKVLGYELSEEFLAMSPEDQKTKGWEEVEDSEGEEDRASKGDDKKGPEGPEEAKEYDKENPAPVFEKDANNEDKEDDMPEEDDSKKDDKGFEEEDDAEDEEDDDTKARRLFGFGDKK